MTNPISSIHKWYLNYETKNQPLITEAATIDFPKKMREEIFEWAKDEFLLMARANIRKKLLKEISDIKERKYLGHEIPDRISNHAKEIVNKLADIIAREQNPGEDILGKLQKNTLDLSKYTKEEKWKETEPDDYRISTNNGEMRLSYFGNTISGHVYNMWPFPQGLSFSQGLEIGESQDWENFFDFNKKTGDITLYFPSSNWMRSTKLAAEDLLGGLEFHKLLGEDAEYQIKLDFKYPEFEVMKVKSPVTYSVLRTQVAQYINFLSSLEEMGQQLLDIKQLLNSFKDTVSELSTKALLRADNTIPMSSNREFPLDITDTEQWAKHEYLRNVWGSIETIVKPLKVGLSNTYDAKRGGYYRERDNYIFLSNTPSYIEKNGAWSALRDLKETIAHELTHMMQYILTLLAKMRSPYLHEYEYCRECNTKVKADTYDKCPKCGGWLLPFEAGLPTTFDPKRFQLYRGVEIDKDDPEYSKKHALSDVEFYARLNDSKHELARAMSSFLYADERGFDYARKLSDIPKAEQFKIFRKRWNNFVKNDYTIKYLREAGETKRLEKYLRELNKEMQKLVLDATQKKEASISKRAGEEMSLWVNKNDGRVLDAGFMSHFDFAADNPDIFGLSKEEAKRLMNSWDKEVSSKLFADWIKITIYHKIINIETREFTSKNLRDIQDLFMDKRIIAPEVLLTTTLIRAENIPYDKFMTVKYPGELARGKTIISKRAAKKNSAGIFAVVPGNLAKGFPSLGEHDDSKPHITVLYIGKIAKKNKKLLEETVKDVLSKHEPFKVELDDKVSYFPASKHSDGCKIAKLKVISKDLHKLHDNLKKAIIDAGIEIDDHFPDYKPHITLEYMEPGKEKYDGDAPNGSWTIESVEIWNDEHKKRFRLGEKSISKRAIPAPPTGDFERPEEPIEKSWQPINDYDSDILYKVLDFDDEELPIATPAELPRLHLTEQDAINQIKKDPVVFLSYSEFLKKFPHLEKMAVEELAHRYPETYFIGQYHNGKYQDLNEMAISNLLLSRPALYFTMGLFNDERFTNKLSDAMNAVVQREPKFFLGVLLPLEKFKEFRHLEDVANEILKKKAFISKRAGVDIAPSDIEKIYELEYKLFKLSQRPQLSDRAYLLKNKWTTELYGLLEKAFAALIDVYDEWMAAEMYVMSSSHPKYVLDKELYESIFKNTPMDKIDIALEKAKKEHIKKIWSEEQPYKNIQKVYNDLKNHKINPNNTNLSIVLFHLALNTAHFGGLMVEHLARYISDTTPSETLKMLNQLSEGKDVEEWNRELEKIAWRYTSWWLSPEGQLFEAPEGHMQFIIDHPELFGESDEPNYKMALDKGWIRIADIDNFMAFSVPGMFSDSHLRNLQGILEKLPKSYNVRVEDDRSILNAPYDVFLWADSVNKLKRDTRFASLKLSKIAKKDKLKEYEKKRKFEKTPEPKGKVSKRDTKKFVIHNHKATKHHWDLRLEHKGVLESWALPKHKLPAGKERLLAVQTEPHPLSYAKFEGEIPEGEYGAGTSMIHDNGKYELIKWEKDTIKFRLMGKKEKGAYTLHKTDGKNWMIMRMKEEKKASIISKRASRPSWEIKEDIKRMLNSIKEVKLMGPAATGSAEFFEEELQKLQDELKKSEGIPENIQDYRRFIEEKQLLKNNAQKLKERLDKEFTVLLSEEYGYRLWFWLPKMSPKELEFWWKSMRTTEPYWYTPEGKLPGELIEVKDEDTDDLWRDMLYSNQYYAAYLNEDDFSSLKRPNGTYVERKE